jgi:acyl-CoA thioester hydrolase
VRDADRRVAEHYPDRWRTRVQYSDVDANRHVNNVAYARWFEEARTRMHLAAFGEQHFLEPPPGVLLVLASTTIEYLAPVGYPAEVTVASRVTKVAGASWTVAHALFHDDRCAALGDALMVKSLHGRPTRLSDAERTGLAHR